MKTTAQNKKLKSGIYRNEMWNHVLKIDPAYILWAENTQPNVHFSKHFLDAAKIELMDEEECHYGEHVCFGA